MLQNSFIDFRIPASAYPYSTSFRQSHSNLPKSTMPPRKVLRRSHRKSRLGCQECKRRHIKVRNGTLSAGTCIYSGSTGNMKNADSSSAMRHSPHARIARAMIAPARICSGYQTHLNAQYPANLHMLLPNQHHQDLTPPGPGRKVYRAQ